MRKSIFRLLPVVGASMLLGALMAGDAPDRTRHPRDMACTECHLAPSDPAQAHKLLAGQEQLCARCHRESLEVSHPSGIHPSMPTPAQLPVDWKGDVTCSTCHRVHDDGRGKMRVAERGRRFCTRCHSDDFFDRMLDRGSSLVAFGHLRSRTELAALNLDGISLRCMECHMDNAPGANVRIDDRGVLRHTASAFNHPVGTEYARAAAFGGYRPATTLDPAILLPDGRISCGSCHRGYTERHGDLTVPTEGSRLCYECHDL